MKQRQRLLKPSKRSFFVFGPRGVGKTTWINNEVKSDIGFDLLNDALFLDFSRDPDCLEERVSHLNRGSWIWIDEIQKVPALLDQVQRLIEKYRFNFILTGSSARKLKRQGANLLGGRVLTKQLAQFSSRELGDDFQLNEAIRWGTLPLVVNYPEEKKQTLKAYLSTYIREEIRLESLVRKVEPFLRFIEISGILNGQQINASNISREAKVARSTVDTYFEILLDTLVGHFLPAYQPQATVQEQAHPRFYWFDAGVARAAAGLLNEEPPPEWLGYAFETHLFHELRVYNETSEKDKKLFYYRNKSGQEIDFVIEMKKKSNSQPAQIIAIECKLSKKWKSDWEYPIRSLRSSKAVNVQRMIGVYSGTEILTHDDYEIFPAEIFLKKLFSGEIF